MLFFRLGCHEEVMRIRPLWRLFPNVLVPVFRVLPFFLLPRLEDVTYINR